MFQCLRVFTTRWLVLAVMRVLFACRSSIRSLSARAGHRLAKLIFYNSTSRGDCETISVRIEHWAISDGLAPGNVGPSGLLAMLGGPLDLNEYWKRETVCVGEVDGNSCIRNLFTNWRKVYMLFFSASWVDRVIFFFNLFSLLSPCLC